MQLELHHIVSHRSKEQHNMMQFQLHAVVHHINGIHAFLVVVYGSSSSPTKSNIQLFP
jgi:hypothetical protein